MTLIALWGVGVLLLPALAIVIDGFAGIRARDHGYSIGHVRSADFRILVPIWGDSRYLTNVEALAPYRQRVTLSTTGDEAPLFYADLDKLAGKHGFRVFTDKALYPRNRRAQVHNARAITDPGMYRFFMTVPQAAGLVIEAAVLADGESVFMLDMGAPHRIVDLVRRYAAYVSPHSETRIAYAGVREGEKLTEVLTGPHETPQATSHPKIIAIKGAEDGGVTPRDIARLCSLAAEGASRGALRRMLAALTTATADR
jgi:hypothetical protein